LDEELSILYKLGINIHTGQRLGFDLKLVDLRKYEYDAVLLTIGASLSKSLDLPGSGLPEIYLALDFLHSVRIGNPLPLPGKAVIIGGGNVAVDCAMTARRLGCADVTMVCLEKREEMPAHNWEIQQALEEGIKIIPGWGPKEFLSEN
jgi:NADPH-dependent glutamate synthase beta subunit-like oxidoreductase